jgi:hypothetical protein
MKLEHFNVIAIVDSEVSMGIFCVFVHNRMERMLSKALFSTFEDIILQFCI